MDRMERLMENLLLFTSEQAVLQRSDGLAPHDDVGRPSQDSSTNALRRKIDLLQSELNDRAAREASSQQELERLRSEVARLRGGTPASYQLSEHDLNDVPADAATDRDPPSHREYEQRMKDGDSHALRGSARDSLRESDVSSFPYASARSELLDDGSEEIDGESTGPLPLDDDNRGEPRPVASPREAPETTEQIDGRRGAVRRIRHFVLRIARNR
jgi:hypothetical protein